ncbi:MULTISPECIES: AAA family ATPase [Massilia]|jgi:MoxR-like ATPase|uniref:AAA domain-containing protein n=2 Tax=Massilia TaxID=149698 RepID=A0A7X3K7N1_9BURK|nr:MULTISPECIES: MoxR family ATPase [Telluria group]KQY08479.1 AAA family ATPase [Massilia sp. Root133]KQZ42300.1 AAA family ATPase [Massilia sp. Root1485]MDN4045529.1 MoxR family ATPase [Massilia sp. YIM B02787]MVW60091.1 AAA domain-containing protein [Telluria cellulosilytica]
MFNQLHAAARQVSQIVVGKDRQVRLALTCLLAGGHLLIDDVPGVGKTTLAHALALALGLKFNRVQFTSDLLPADVAGISVYEREKSGFVFHPGPVFTQVLLADEINRATPKTQSGLLEAMEERQVTADGVTRALPEPFFVIATQNPAHQVGTFPLPESQLDRFLMCLSLGYPDAAAERALLMGEDRRAMLKTIEPVMRPEELLDAQRSLRAIHASDKLIDYLQALAQSSRSGKLFAEGLSPRATLALLQAARAWAALEGRDHVIPEDVQALLVPVCAHRLRPLRSAQGVAMASRDLVLQLQKSVPV